MRTVAILGAGGMGTALAILMSRAVGTVRLWARDPERAATIQASRCNERHLPEAILPENVQVSHHVAEVVAGADVLVAAIPTAFLRISLEPIAPIIPSHVPVLSVVKGIERESFARPSRIILETLGRRQVSVLSGPSHAEEIARGLPASVVVAGDDETLNVAIRDTLNGPAFRVYTNSDVIGVEMAGALKNILGVAAGICDGLRSGDNAKAGLLTRGLIEIARFSCDMGARPATFLGLAGVGDMMTTCYSPFGRNRAVGLKIGQGMKLPEILAGMTDVAEGVTTTVSARALAIERGVEMPITDEVYQILFADKPPRTAVSDLMLRLPKVEWP